MVDKKLISYIKHSLVNGHALNTIKKHLFAHGHKEEEIGEALSAVNKDYEENNIL